MHLKLCIQAYTLKLLHKERVCLVPNSHLTTAHSTSTNEQAVYVFEINQVVPLHIYALETHVHTYDI